jgi:hypothetical protein
MPANIIPPPSIFHMLEKNVGKKVLVILNQAYGFEGTLAAITHDPPGIWLSDAEAVIFRSAGRYGTARQFKVWRHRSRRRQ